MYAKPFKWLLSISTSLHTHLAFPFICKKKVELDKENNLALLDSSGTRYGTAIRKWTAIEQRQ